ncbi:multidrug efflux SMR transporter [Agromyces mediolanus]|uniref:DMT family transporter n=1 Tax=Agromyces mediolanus TaxID=41986 RepID=UPI00203A5DE5|nr:multidrug efflux SMR transporter [Agromyces mediolanus]MCM3658311.1 multidrug efflux SMR transporter [Agromyces mediolanus]
MAWLFLSLAIAFEVAATSFIGKTEGFTKLWWTVGVLAGYGVSFLMLAQAVRELEIGIVYAIWSGVGTAAIVAIGVLFLGESLTVPKLIGIGLIIAGVIVLNVFAGHSAAHA